MIPTQIVIHHTASNINTPISEIDRWHKMRGFPKSSIGFYIGYHYVIDAAGRLFQTRRDNEIGAHCPPNEGKIGIALIGNFMIFEPREAQLETLTDLINKLENYYNIDYAFGHRDFCRTECPGDELYKYALIDKINWLQKLINKIKNRIYAKH